MNTYTISTVQTYQISAPDAYAACLLAVAGGGVDHIALSVETTLTEAPCAGKLAFRALASDLILRPTIRQFRAPVPDHIAASIERVASWQEDAPVPEPMRVPPAFGSLFYTTTDVLRDGDYTAGRTWRGTWRDIDALDSGVVHRTYLAANLHAKSLLASKD